MGCKHSNEATAAAYSMAIVNEENFGVPLQKPSSFYDIDGRNTRKVWQQTDGEGNNNEEALDNSITPPSTRRNTIDSYDDEEPILIGNIITHSSTDIDDLLDSDMECPIGIAELVETAVIIPEEQIRICEPQQRMLILHELPPGAVAGTVLRLTTQEGLVLHITVPSQYVHGSQIVVPYEI